MLFNLTTHKSFPCLKPSDAIKCIGPTFGYYELSIIDEPFNLKNACMSMHDEVYKIPVDRYGNNLLTNKKSPKFTITEIEVWGVTFCQ